MFYIVNKDKIISAAIAAGTVAFLLFMTTTISNNNIRGIPVSAKITKQLPIYSVDTEKKEVALTINCAW